MKSKLIQKNWRNVFAAVLLIFIWHVAAWAVNRGLYLPSPLETFKEMAELLTLPQFWLIVFGTVLRVILGLLIAVIIGVPAGFASAFSKTVHAVLQPFVVSVKSTPVMSFIIIALFWFSSDFVPVFIGLLMSFPIIWTSISDGIRQVDKRLLDMAKVFKVEQWLIVKKIYIPSVMPFFISALKSAFGLTWKVTVASEVLSNPKYGIGTHLMNAKIYLESETLFAWTAVVVIMSLLFEWMLKKGFDLLGRRYMRNGGINDIH